MIFIQQTQIFLLFLMHNNIYPSYCFPYHTAEIKKNKNIDIFNYLKKEKMNKTIINLENKFYILYIIIINKFFIFILFYILIL